MFVHTDTADSVATAVPEPRSIGMMNPQTTCTGLKTPPCRRTGLPLACQARKDSIQPRDFFTRCSPVTDPAVLLAQGPEILAAPQEDLFCFPRPAPMYF